MSLFKHNFNSTAENVSAAICQAKEWLLGRNIDEICAGQVELVLAEAANNIVEHAFEFAPNGKVELQIRFDGNHVRIRLTDNGKIFPGVPEKKEMQGDQVDFDRLPEGGFGWFLIHELSSSITYTRQNDCNILDLGVPIRADASAA